MAKQHIADPQPRMSPQLLSVAQMIPWPFALARQTLFLSLSLANSNNLWVLPSSLPVMLLELTWNFPPIPHPDFLLLASLAPGQIQKNTEVKVRYPVKCGVTPSCTLHSPISLGTNKRQLKVTSKIYRHSPSSRFTIQGSKHRTPMPLAGINNSFLSAAPWSWEEP